VDVADYIDHLESEGQALAEAAADAGGATAVPTCPGWTVDDLLGHTGVVHRYAIEYVRLGRNAYGGGRPVFAEVPATGVLEWYLAGHGALVSALRAAPADLDCWQFLPAPSPLAFWARRQAHETAIHRADAESARDRVPDFPRRFAVDGLAELLELFWGRSRGALLADPPRSLTVAPTDSGRRWHIVVGPEFRTITADSDLPGNAAADLVWSGAASDLYLDVWNRPPRGPVHIEGDPQVLKLWRDVARIAW
jgi:uncharacterized protein (TIGR03083 family)